MAENDSFRLSGSPDNAAEYSAAKGRRFAFTVAVAFGVLGALTAWRGREWTALVFGMLAFALAFAGILFPTRLEPVERAWMKVAHAISRVTTPIFMGIVYFAVLTPVGALRRTLGRSPIVHLPDGGSYWIARPHAEPEARRRRMERQF